MKFLTLDALRGLAAVTIVVVHIFGEWGGYLAVDFFLVLSGFILSHNYLYKNPATPMVFIVHRLARLYPLHIYTLLTFTLAFFISYQELPSYKDGNLATLLQHLTLTQNVGLRPHYLTWNYPSWSISVEMWVNVIFIFFISKTTRSLTLFACSVAGLLVIYLNTGHLNTNTTNYFYFVNSGMLRGMSSFIIGILSYRIYLHFKEDASVKKYANHIEMLCVIGVVIVVFGRAGKSSAMDFLTPYVFMCVVAVFAYENGWLSNSLKKLSYLGEISYSIYLNQVTVVILLEKFTKNLGMTRWSILIGYFVVLILYSHLTYRYIEKPLRLKGRRVWRNA